MIDCRNDPPGDLDEVEYVELSIDAFHRLRLGVVMGSLGSSLAFSDGGASCDRFWSLSNWLRSLIWTQLDFVHT